MTESKNNRLGLIFRYNICRAFCKGFNEKEYTEKREFNKTTYLNL